MNEKIHYDDFVEQVALESGFDLDTAKDYVDTLFETIVEQSAQGRNVKIKNFGSFQPRWSQAKRGINPQTGQPLDILPHYHIHYAVSKGLDETLNSGEKVTKIAIDEKPNIFGKIFTVVLIALLITLIYRSFFMPDDQIVQLPTKELNTPETKDIAHESDEPVKQEPDEEKTVEEPQPIVTQEIKKESAPTLPAYYKVQTLQTLSEISVALYGNSAYWPLLFASNSSKIVSPDLIYEGSTLKVPAISTGLVLQKAYLAAYQSYMKHDKFSKSFWTLCSGAKFMGEDFIKFLSNHIDEAELKVVKKCYKP